MVLLLLLIGKGCEYLFPSICEVFLHCPALTYLCVVIMMKSVNEIAQSSFTAVCPPMVFSLDLCDSLISEAAEVATLFTSSWAHLSVCDFSVTTL